MDKFEDTRMQGEPARGIAFRLVFYIADDRMAGIRKMDPNLVAAAGFQSQLHQRSPLVPGQDSEMRDSVARLIAARRAEDAEGIRFVEIRFKHAAVASQLSLNDRFVLLLREIPASLQCGFHIGRLGKDHQPRGFAVESMNDPDPLAPMGQVLVQLKIGRLLLLRFACDAQEILRLFDHNEVRVFEIDLHPAAQYRLRDGKTIRTHGDDIARPERMIELCDRPPINRDRLELQPGPHLLSFHLWPCGEKVLQKLRGLRDKARLGHCIRTYTSEVPTSTLA